jgi:hypothetical protein
MGVERYRECDVSRNRKAQKSHFLLSSHPKILLNRDR